MLQMSIGIENFSPLSLLSRVEVINIFFNQKATALWDMSNNLSLRGLEMDDLSKLLSLFPEDLKGMIVEPYREGSTVDAKGNNTTFYFLCKGKKKLTKGIDDEELRKYVDEFDGLVKRYRNK